MEQDVIYFELNNWFAGKDYPDAEPFRTWMKDSVLQFSDDEWVKENKLCVYISMVDMSVNFCITATREWVEKNCPKLLSDEGLDTVFIHQSANETKEVKEEWRYKDFLRFPDDGVVKGRFGCPFFEYSEENFGVHWYKYPWEDYYEDDE